MVYFLKGLDLKHGQNELWSKTELSTIACTELSPKKIRGFWSIEILSNTELLSNEWTDLSSINNYSEKSLDENLVTNI